MPEQTETPPTPVAGTIVIIPVINELPNLQEMIPQVLEHAVDVLVVDDASTDGTADWLKAHPLFEERIFLIERPRKMGLGTAYVTGFGWAMGRGYDVLMQMDADLSHRAEDLPAVLEPVIQDQADLVIGSRYIDGVRVLNWPIRRLLLSVAAMKYAQVCIGWKIRDSTGGFKAIHRRVLEAISLENIRSNGYVFQVEVNFRTYRAGWRIREVPIVFVERRVGASKMNFKIIGEALVRVALMRVTDLCRRLTGRRKYDLAPARRNSVEQSAVSSN